MNEMWEQFSRLTKEINTLKEEFIKIKAILKEQDRIIKQLYKQNAKLVKKGNI